MNFKDTNMVMVKEVAKRMFDAVEITPVESIPFLCQHPFTNSMFGFVTKNTKGLDDYVKSLPKGNDKVTNEDGGMVDLNNDLGKEVFRNHTFNMIDRCKELGNILMMMNKAYYTTFFKYVEPYLSKKDTGKMLGECWIMEEYPNKDANVTIPEFIKYFKDADKKSLMDKDELMKFNEIRAKASSRDGIKLYRGISFDGKPNGLSWTTDLKKAQWFANRWYDASKGKSNPKVYEITVKNSDSILAYFGGRGESEVILDTSVEKNWEIVKKNQLNKVGIQFEKEDVLE